MDCFASLAMTVSNSSALSRLLPGIEPGINPALEARKSFQALASANGNSCIRITPATLRAGSIQK